MDEHNIFRQFLGTIKTLMQSQQKTSVSDKKLAREFIAQTKMLNKNISVLTDGIEYVSGQLAEISDKLDAFVEDEDEEDEDENDKS